MDKSLEKRDNNNIAFPRSMVSDSSKVVISSILTLREYLEAKIRKFIKIIQNLFHEDETLTFLDQKSSDIGKRIAKDGWQ